MTSSTDSQIASTYRLEMFAAISIIIAVVAVLIAYAAIRSTRSQRHEIVLVDTGGRPRVRIGVLAEGGAIELLDEHGRARIALRQEGEDSSILMRRKDPEEATFAAGFLVDENRNFLEMRDPATGARVFLYTSSLSLGVISNHAHLSASNVQTQLLLSDGLSSPNYSHARYVVVELEEPRTKVGFFVPKDHSSASVKSAPFMLNGHDVPLERRK